jgi:hypothetical protein
VVVVTIGAAPIHGLAIGSKHNVNFTGALHALQSAVDS